MYFFSLLLACPQPKIVHTEADAPTLSDNQIVLVHTNDLHGHFLPERAKWLEGEPEIGGFEAIDVHMSDLMSGRQTLESFDAVAACGGFSYGDVLDSAKGWGSNIPSKIAI